MPNPDLWFGLGREVIAVRTVFVDYNPLETGERNPERGRGADIVALTGDPDMPEQQAKLKELTPDGYAVLELVRMVFR